MGDLVRCPLTWTNRTRNGVMIGESPSSWSHARRDADATFQGVLRETIGLPSGKSQW